MLDPSENATVATARTEPARLGEIEQQLAGTEISDRARQALVAEQIRLRRNAEERAKQQRLRELLRGGAVADVVGAMRGAGGGAATELARRREDIELLFSAEAGRQELGRALGEHTGATFAQEGFDGLCSLVELALSQMTQATSPVFDAFLVCAHPPPASAQGRAHGAIVYHLDFPRQPEGEPVPLDPGSGKPRSGKPPSGVEHFCFPVDPAVGTPPSNYTIVRTLDDGTRQYGFCRSVTLDGVGEGEEEPTTEVLCLLSRYPWFSMFEAVMLPVAEARVKGGYAAVEQLLDAIFDYAAESFPMPGERFKIERPEQEGESLFLTRPNDELSPLIDVDYCDLFRSMGVEGVAAILRSLLAEGHCVFVSADFRRLGMVVQAAASMLYPFKWQHIFVPILPHSWIDYITAPMPFVCGIHASMLDEVLQQPIEDSMVFAKLDTGELLTVGEMPGSLPNAGGGKLEKAFHKLLADLKKSKIDVKDFNTGVREACVEFMLDMFGGYRTCVGALDEGNFEFDFDRFVGAAPDDNTADFIRTMQDTQMFDIWCRERCALAAEGYPQIGLFESQVAGRADSSATGSRRAKKDVTTARMLVDVSGQLTMSGGAGESVLERIRQHELWKNGSLWESIFEDGLDEALVTQLQTLRQQSQSVAGSPSGKKGGSDMDEVRQRLEGEFCAHMLGFAETMMRFGLPLDLVMRFADAAADRHGVRSAGNVKDRIMSDVSPRFAHLRPATKTGWMDVETKKRWDRRWFAIRGTSLCLHESDTSTQPSSVFPCGACEIVEPKSKRKGHDYVFRLNVAEYAVGSTASQSGTASKSSALKFIVSVATGAERVAWYKAFDDAGAVIPELAKAALRSVAMSGWLDVETAVKAKKRWDRRWFAIRGTSLCLHESDTSTQPSSVFPCGACEIVEPKNIRKGHHYVFRVNVADYAVGGDSKAGSSSKSSALKFIVSTATGDVRLQWYKAFDAAGAVVPALVHVAAQAEARAAETAAEETTRFAAHQNDQEANEANAATAKAELARNSAKKRSAEEAAQQRVEEPAVAMALLAEQVRCPITISPPVYKFHAMVVVRVFVSTIEVHVVIVYG